MPVANGFDYLVKKKPEVCGMDGSEEKIGNGQSKSGDQKLRDELNP